MINSTITRKKLRGELRLLLNEIPKDHLRNPELNEWLNLAVDTVRELLGKNIDVYYYMWEMPSPWYLEKPGGSTSSNHARSLHRIDNIIYIRRENRNHKHKIGTGVTYDYSNDTLNITDIFSRVWAMGLVLWGDNNDYYGSRIFGIGGPNCELLFDPRGSNLSANSNNWAVFLYPEIDLDRKMKLVDLTNGDIPFVDYNVLEKFSKVDLYNSSVFASLFGNEIHLFKGSDAPSYGYLKLWYHRKPIRMFIDNQPMDMPLQYKDLVLKEAKLIALEKLGQIQDKI